VSNQILLVVDDERVQRLIVTRAVEALGYAVDEASNLEMAAAALAKRHYDAIVLDLSLGENEGITLLHRVRAHGGDPLVVLMSGLDNRVLAASRRLADALGVRVAGAIEKPVLPSQLRLLLREAPPPPEEPKARQSTTASAELLEAAIERHEVTVAYQPKVALADERVVGVEALARWRPGMTGDPVPPDSFIRTAEQHGLIIPLTRQILQDALAACRRWQDLQPDCSVAVNISPLVLTNPTLPDEIEAALEQNGLPPGALVAEITESLVISDPVLATEVLTRLRIKGVRLSIDDFGTGHSSLLSLMRLPFTELKIDRSFISTCEVDPEAWKIIRATISLAHELGLQVVAEGIETDSVCQRLLGAGCDIGQGWLFGRAMPEDALTSWFDARATAPA
jgi:EAL domain-containing protein (putative c-di-GMP-specific phosphodiesterase class I)